MLYIPPISPSIFSPIYGDNKIKTNLNNYINLVINAKQNKQFEGNYELEFNAEDIKQKILKEAKGFRISFWVATAFAVVGIALALLLPVTALTSSFIIGTGVVSAGFFLGAYLFYREGNQILNANLEGLVCYSQTRKDNSNDDDDDVVEDVPPQTPGTSREEASRQIYLNEVAEEEHS